MKLEAFRERYGQAFYGFINSELGQAMVAVLKENDPASTLAHLPPESQTANAVLYLGQITGWRAAIVTLMNNLIIGPEGPKETEPTYEAGNNDDDVKRFLSGAAKPEPTIPRGRKKK